MYVPTTDISIFETLCAKYYILVIDSNGFFKSYTIAFLQTQPSGVFCKKAVLKNFAIFTQNNCVEVSF